MLQFVDFTQSMQAERAKAQAWLNERNEVLKRLEEAQAAVAELEKLAKEYSPESTQKVLDYMADIDSFLFRTEKTGPKVEETVSSPLSISEAHPRPELPTAPITIQGIKNTVLRKEC